MLLRLCRSMTRRTTTTCFAAQSRFFLRVRHNLFCSCCIVYFFRRALCSLPGTTRYPVASSYAARNSYVFVTFAFTADAGGRWNAANCKTAIQLMYSSLVRSQSEYPQLHLYSNDPGVVPLLTTMKTTPHIILQKRQTQSFPSNEYSDLDKWRALSLAKLDAVEEVMRKHGVRAIWVDLDTLIFVDLKPAVGAVDSWVVGYQSGGCGGTNKNCSYEHTARGGLSNRDIEPAYDTYGDLWSLSLQTIDHIKSYRQRYVEEKLTLPLYDLQGYITFMLMDGVLNITFLHEIIPCNFGFFCSDFVFPTESNLEVTVRENHLACPTREFVPMTSRVGSMSFTALTFQKLFLKASTRFQFIADENARIWLTQWFYSKSCNNLSAAKEGRTNIENTSTLTDYGSRFKCDE